ncbi:MAG TPA: glycerophosphodiester phosphodiesterase family protein [Prosthecobacter sp.]
MPLLTTFCSGFLARSRFLPVSAFTWACGFGVLVLASGAAVLGAGPSGQAAAAAPRCIVQSHRGAGVLAAENTIAAFELGWNLGTLPEADIRTTKDGVIVAFHDANFARVVHGADEALKKKGVQDVTFAELSRLEVGAEVPEGFQRRKVSTLAEIFALMKGRPDREMYLDIKQVSLPALAALAKEHSVAPQVILASTKMEVIHEWKTLLPDSQTLHWMGGKEAELEARLEALDKEGFKDVTQVQIHVRQAADSQDWASFTPSEAFMRRTGERLKKHGVLFQSLPWGADSPGIYEKLLELGVQSFATDHPDVLMPVMRKHLGLEERRFLNNGVTAHRGSSMEHPENTLEAFRHGLELGVDWIELDLFQTADGQIVVTHDATTGRVGDRDLAISRSTYAQLREVDVAADFRKRNQKDVKSCPPARMPLLAEVLDLIQAQHRTRASLQPKDGCTAAAIDLIRQRKAAAWVGFNDGSLEKMTLVKKLEPSLPVFWDRPAKCDLAADLKTAQELGFETLVIHKDGITQERIHQCHAAGIQVGAWTVNDVDEIGRFLIWGIDRIYTDDPRLLLRLKK